MPVERGSLLLSVKKKKEEKREMFVSNSLSRRKKKIFFFLSLEKKGSSSFSRKQKNVSSFSRKKDFPLSSPLSKIKNPIKIKIKSTIITNNRRDGRAQRLTYDHKASDEGEQKRVVLEGGKIMLGRVGGRKGRRRG